MTQHILIVEDDPAIANTLRYALARESWQVTWVDTAGQVLPTLHTSPNFTAILLDMGLPDGSGLDVCQAIRHGKASVNVATNVAPSSTVATPTQTDYTHIPILFLTARDDEIDKVLGLEMGADDYITKPFSTREVIARLKAIWRREQHYEQLLETQLQNNALESAHLTQKNAIHPLPNPWSSPATSVHTTTDFDKKLPTGQWSYLDRIYQLAWNGRVVPLSKTELAIMLALLAQPSHILSRDQILSAISDYPEHRLARTIDSHIKTLRQKLADIDPSLEVIVTHRGLGYGLNQQKIVQE